MDDNIAVCNYNNLASSAGNSNLTGLMLIIFLASFFSAKVPPIQLVSERTTLPKISYSKYQPSFVSQYPFLSGILLVSLDQRIALQGRYIIT